MPLRFLKAGMDFVFGSTEHEAMQTNEATINSVSTSPDIAEARPVAYSPELTLERPDYRSTGAIVGTRRSNPPMHFMDSDQTTVSTTYEQLGRDIIIDGWEVAQNEVPVLKFFMILQSLDSGQTFSVALTTAKRGVADPIFEYTTGTGNDTLEHYFERFMTSVDYADIAKNNFENSALQLYGKVNGGTNGGRLDANTHVRIDEEVV